VLPDSNKQYPLTIERVRKIKSLNSQGIIPDELEAVEVVSGKAKEVEPEAVELVGQISLRTLEKAEKKKKQQQQQQRQKGQGPRNQGPQQNPNRQQGNQQRGPQQNQNKQQGQQRNQHRGPNRPPQPPRRDK
jgi:hypothetical protein